MESGFKIEKFSIRKINISSSSSLIEIFFLFFVSSSFIFLSLSPSLFSYIFDLESNVVSLASPEHHYVKVRCSATVRDSWSSSRDEDHDCRDAEVELAEKKRGARAGSFFRLFHFFGVILFVAQSLTTLSSFLFFPSFQFHIRNFLLYWTCDIFCAKYKIFVLNFLDQM